jgi:hypothetical protein
MFDLTRLKAGLRTGVLAAPLALALATAAVPLTAVAAEMPSAVQARLAELGVERDQVKSFDLVAQKNASAGAGSYTRGYLAYVRLTDADGYLVIGLTRGKDYRDTFTTGDLSLPGVPRY